MTKQHAGLGQWAKECTCQRGHWGIAEEDRGLRQLQGIVHCSHPSVQHTLQTALSGEQDAAWAGKPLGWDFKLRMIGDCGDWRRTGRGRCGGRGSRTGRRACTPAITVDDEHSA